MWIQWDRPVRGTLISTDGTYMVLRSGIEGMRIYMAFRFRKVDSDEDWLHLLSWDTPEDAKRACQQDHEKILAEDESKYK